jgi:hypothetical protein
MQLIKLLPTKNENKEPQVSGSFPYRVSTRPAVKVWAARYMEKCAMAYAT